MNVHNTLLLYLHSTPEGKEILIESEILYNSFNLKLQVLGTVTNQKNTFKLGNGAPVKESKNRGTEMSYYFQVTSCNNSTSNLT